MTTFRLTIGGTLSPLLPASRSAAAALDLNDITKSTVLPFKTEIVELLAGLRTTVNPRALRHSVVCLSW